MYGANLSEHPAWNPYLSLTLCPLFHAAMVFMIWRWEKSQSKTDISNINQDISMRTTDQGLDLVQLLQAGSVHTWRKCHFVYTLTNKNMLILQGFGELYNIFFDKFDKKIYWNDNKWMILFYYMILKKNIENKPLHIYLNKSLCYKLYTAGTVISYAIY